MKFRKDINGLRAIAVIAVLLFHFNPSWLPGGFAGVDVFFVISGFLMTGIIFRGIEQNNFSLLKFYVARVNRIVPALVALCLFLLIFGWFYLTPLDYKALGKHVAGSLTFVSNIFYWRESGYFDASSLEKWLLHTWSLSIEWQFYILYPLVLIAIKRTFSPAAIKPLILTATVLSFTLCLFVTYKHPSASYFLLPTRAWEMLMGGVAYLYPFTTKGRQKRALELLGLAFIIGSYFLVSADTPWPGYLSLFPVLGTFLVIQAQRQQSMLTGNIVFEKIGLWSYSIYLWHWPIVVAIYYYSLNEVFIYIGILLSVVLGFLSYQYIEKIKFSKDVSFNLLYKNIPVHCALLLAIAASYIFTLHGAKFRFEEQPNLQHVQAKLVTPTRKNGHCFYSVDTESGSVIDKEIGTECYLGDKSAPASTLLFGDSFAGHNEPFFNKVFKKNKASFQSVVTNWCYPSFTEEFTGRRSSPAYAQCLLNREFLKENIGNYKNIILAGSWGSVSSKGLITDVKEVIKEAANHDANVFIMAAPPSYTKIPLQIFYKSIYLDTPLELDTKNSADTLTSKANKILKREAKKYKNVHFIDRDLLYEEDGLFSFKGYKVPYSLDGLHISQLGSEKSAEHFMRHVKYKKVINKFEL